MSGWLRYSMLSMLAYGVWGAVSSLASQNVSPLTLQIVSTLGLFPVALVLLFSKNIYQGSDRRRGILLAMATGVIGGTGNLTLYQALRMGGEASVVFPLTGMYPLVTLILARLLLKERLNRVQGVGIALALVAIYLFSAQQGTRAFTGWQDLFSPWMAYGLLTLLLFGMSCITQKFTTRYISDELSTIFFTDRVRTARARDLAGWLASLESQREGLGRRDCGGSVDGHRHFGAVCGAAAGKGFDRHAAHGPVSADYGDSRRPVSQ